MLSKPLLLRVVILLAGLCGAGTWSVQAGPQAGGTGFQQASAQNARQLIDSHDELYDWIALLAMESGRSSPFQARPWSVAQVSTWLELLDTAKLSSGALALYERTREKLETLPQSSKGNSALYIRPGFFLEGYYTSLKDQHWEYGYEQRLPLAHIPLGLGVADRFWAQMDLTLKEEYRAISEDTENYTNFPTALTYLDWYFPFTAYTSLGGDWWTIQFGRDRLSWGNGISGNLVLGDHADFHDLARASVHWDWFSFSSVYIVLDSWLTPEEQANATGGWYPNYNELYKAFAGHRFDFAIGSFAKLAVIEASLFGNKYPQLSDLNPVMIMHNYFIPERANSMFAAEVDITPWRWFSLGAQYALDEFETSYEEGSGTRPGATAWLVNLRGTIPLGMGTLGLKSEYAHIDPWMYNRWHPNTRYTIRRRIWSYIPTSSSPVGGYEWVDKALGHAAGPDNDIALVRAEYELGLPQDSWLSAGVAWQWRRHSNLGLHTPYSLSQRADELRTGWQYDQQLQFDTDLSLPKGLKVGGRLSLNWYENYLGQNGASVFSLELAVHAGWRLR